MSTMTTKYNLQFIVYVRRNNTDNVSWIPITSKRVLPTNKMTILAHLPMGKPSWIKISHRSDNVELFMSQPSHLSSKCDILLH